MFLVLLVLCATTPVVHSAHAFGHMLAFVLSPESPLWPCDVYDEMFSARLMSRMGSIRMMANDVVFFCVDFFLYVSGLHHIFIICVFYVYLLEIAFV